MNFFEHQERARRSTFRLLVLFVLAVLSIIAGVYFAIRVMMRVGFNDPDSVVAIRPWWDGPTFVLVAMVTALFIAGVSGARIRQLGRGGGALALLLGGRPVPASPKDQPSRVYRNVVEEMAVASGVPPPEVYLLDDEEGINAFAAGRSQEDAAVAVTGGALRRLSRDELQGVVAHEFSHILNGDMRMNLRIAGVLHGILAIGAVGRGLVRITPGRFGGGKKGGSVPLIAGGGMVLILVGAIGTLLGRMIQSAVCRQREFLADSSAVQFTRNPEGIGGALKKIGGGKDGSRVKHPQAEHAAHLLFGEGRRVFFLARLFATHPPLEERIRRIDPRFDGRFPRTSEGIEALAAFPGLEEAIRGLGGKGGTIRLEPEAVTRRIGRPTAEHVAFGAALLERIPVPLREAVRSPEGALRTVLALLLPPEGDGRRRCAVDLAERLDPEEAEGAARLAATLGDLDRRARLPLADLAFPALRSLPSARLDRALDCVDRLIDADEEVTVFEFCLRKLLEKRLRGAAGRGPAPAGGRRKGAVPLGDAAVLLGAIARCGRADDPEGARAAFRAGASKIVDPRRTALPFRPEEPPDFTRLGAALDRLAAASLPVKEKILSGAAHAAFADRRVDIEEAELLRVVSSVLGVPLPLFLPEPVQGSATPYSE